MADEANRVTASWGSRSGGWSILVHGGAGNVPADRVELHVEGCRLAAAAAASVLRAGGRALDAAQRAVEVLEADPHFNAGTGACLNADGEIELDASIMEGASLAAGAVCALPPFLHPIAIARAALDDGTHILYAADGAERFALAHGFTRSTSAEMTTPSARARWEAVANASVIASPGGTVGAVARDAGGSLAAATSTGGRTNKLRGRVGDSPILGAGTYADDLAGACSNTGDGEAVMRVCLAKTAVEWMRGGMLPEDAARAAINLLASRGGGRAARGELVEPTGGIILIDRVGTLGWARNTATMTWGAAAEGWEGERAGS